MTRHLILLLAGLAGAVLFEWGASTLTPAEAVLFSGNPSINNQIVSSVVIGTAPGSNACNGTATGSSCTWPNTQNTSNTAGSEPYNYIGTLSAVLSSGTPPYSGGYTLAAGGSGNCTGHTFDTSHFSVSSGDLVIASGGSAPVAGNTYYVCIEPSVGGTTSNAIALTIPVYHFIDAVALGCSGSGTTASPWTAACISAAVTSASTGDTVFLQAGNYDLDTGQSPVTISKTINLVGAASGNTFDAYGHPNNGYCSTAGSDACLPSGFTRIYTGGSSSCITACVGGWVSFTSCSNANVAHIFVDGSVATAGGDGWGTLNFQQCNGSTVNDIRVWSYQSSTFSGETQFWIKQSDHTSVQNSIFAEPPYYSSGFYSGGQVAQSQEQNYQLVNNNMFWEESFNPFYTDSDTYTDNTNYQMADPGGNNSPANGAFSFEGCAYGTGCFNGGTTGNYHDYIYNNYFTGGNVYMSIGGGPNDPPQGGGALSDLQAIGNWVVGTDTSVDSCAIHLAYGGGVSCLYGATSGGNGPQINISGNGYSFISQNNSIIGSSSAHLTATGSGCTSSGQGATCSSNGNETQTVNFNATQNYLQSPSNHYDSDAGTITPTVTGNYCDNASHSSPTHFTQTDATQCATSGFTTAPTCTFTLGPLTGSVVPITATTFIAQYGAVQYIAQAASTPPSTPNSSDSRWNYSGNGNGGNQSYIPPYSVAASHGNTVYMWVMDNAATPHIAACTATGSAVVY